MADPRENSDMLPHDFVSEDGMHWMRYLSENSQWATSRNGYPLYVLVEVSE